MAVAANPGVGRGKGGGRPKRGPVARMRLDLTPEAAALLETHSAASGAPIWKLADDAIRAALGNEPPQGEMPRAALERAQEAAQFLAANPDGSKPLLRAWRQALALASHAK